MNKNEEENPFSTDETLIEAADGYCDNSSICWSCRNHKDYPGPCGMGVDNWSGNVTVCILHENLH